MNFQEMILQSFRGSALKALEDTSTAWGDKM